MDDRGDRLEVLAGALTETAKERRDAFRSAADRAGDPDLRFLFISCFFQRIRILDGLKKALPAPATETADGSPGLAQSVKEGVAEIRAKLGPAGDRKVLRELIEEEAEFLEQYKRLLDAPLPEGIRDLVVSQFEDVLATYTRLVEVERISEPSR